MSRAKNIEEIKEFMFNNYNNEYDVLDSHFINGKTKFEIKHKSCNTIFYHTFGELNGGRVCPKCGLKNRKSSMKKTTESFKIEVSKIVQDEYEVLGEYVNNKTKIKMKHNKCGYEYLVRPNDFQQGYRCPKCSLLLKESESLILIKSILKENNISFKEEVKFKNLKYKRKLIVDLYIKEFNLVIEFDGQQHFLTRGSCKFNTSIHECVKRDWIKNNFFKNTGTKFLRIHYSLCDNNLRKIINNIIENKELALEIVDKFCLYYYNGYETFNELKYYSSRSPIYFSEFAEDIEKMKRLTCLPS